MKKSQLEDDFPFDKIFRFGIRQETLDPTGANKSQNASFQIIHFK